MSSYKWKTLLTGLVFTGICGGLYFAFLRYPIPNTELFTVSLTDLSFCKAETKIGETAIFPNTIESISVCGQLQVNDPPLHMVARWYYQDKQNLIFREVISNVDQKSYLLKSTLKPTETTFQSGNYGVEFIIGRAIVWNIEFQVE